MAVPEDADPHLVPLHQALSKLGPAVEILSGFQHRNKNQHRLSRWWGPFDMLRRHARRLEGDLNAQLTCCERELQRRRRKSSGKMMKGHAVSTADDADLGIGEMVAARAVHLRDTLVPRAFLAFTQLTTELQFAQLGVLLITVLAQVESSLKLLLGPRTAQDAPGGPETDPRLIAQQPDKVAAFAAGKAELADMGVVVCRETLVDSTPDSSRRKASSFEEPAMTQRDAEAMGASEPRDLAKGSLKKRRKRTGDQFDDIFGSVSGKKRSTEKKRKKGDEFDAIFSALS